MRFAPRRLRFVVAFPVLAVAFLVAGAWVGVAPNADAFQSVAGITIRVHSCPDDLDATGFYQHLQRCTSTQGLFGVPLKITFADGTTSYMYTQPSDDETRAQPIRLGFIPSGLTVVSEVVSTRIRESVVFCSLQPGGAFPTPDTSQPPTMDGDEVYLRDGAVSFNLERGDALDCDWYRFPGGIASETEDEGGEEANQDQDPQGGMIRIHKWLCDAGDVDPDADKEDVEGYLNDLEASCAASEQGFSFDLSDDTEDGQDYPEQIIGGQDGGDMGWDGLVPAQYAISEDLSGDYDEPIVICEGSLPAAVADQGEDQENAQDNAEGRNLVLIEAHHGDVFYDLKENETLVCEWFNLARTGGQDDHGDDADAPPDQTDDGNNDDDRDGIVDTDEAQYGTDPTNRDTDGDGLVDGDEVTYGYDPLNTDTDGDALSDSDEAYNYLTDPTNADSDADGLADGDEANTYLTNPTYPDTDGDSLSDGDEVNTLHTDPNNVDTDADGASDATEGLNQTDPLDPNSN